MFVCLLFFSFLNHLGIPVGRLFEIWLSYCLAYFVIFCLNHLGILTRKFPKSFINIGLVLGDILSIWNCFICLFVCLFSFASWDTHTKISWKFHKDLTWFGWDIINLKMFVCFFICFCLFFKSSGDNLRRIFWKFLNDQTWYGWSIVDLKTVYLFVCILVCLFDFFLNHIMIPTGRFPESFWKIWLDLADILLIWKFVYLCFCFFGYVVFFSWIISRYPQEDLKTVWQRLDLIWLLKYCWYKNVIFVCCSFVCLFLF